MAAALITDGCQCIPVNPATVSFEKSAYPAIGSEYVQFSSIVDDATKRNMWCIRLRCKPRVNAKWEMKGSLRPLTHEGFYVTEKEAKSEVFDHRMILEGYERRGGYWYPPMSMSSGARWTWRPRDSTNTQETS
jgi:hypothetical protein